MRCVSTPAHPQGLGEPVRQLACKHCFHELCIRGWTIVGKKDVCPVCLEKVDMRDLYADKPWETQNLSWWVA
jgi:RING finger protein 121